MITVDDGMGGTMEIEGYDDTGQADQEALAEYAPYEAGSADAYSGYTTGSDGNITEPTYNDAKFNIPGNLGTEGNSNIGSTLWGLAKSLGLTNKEGGLDMSKIAGLGLAGISLADSLNAPAYKPKTPGELLAMQPSNTLGAFSADKMAAFSKPFQAGNQLARQSAASMTSPIAAGQRYAEGGTVQGPLSMMEAPSNTQGGPFVGLVPGDSGGQDDLIEARLSPGEYVFDAEAVAMFGDGNNAAGAKRLDELREQLRAHKRSAPNDEIAPPSAGPLSYMNGGQ